MLENLKRVKFSRIYAKVRQGTPAKSKLKFGKFNKMRAIPAFLSIFARFLRH